MQPYLQYILLLGAVVIVVALVLPRKKISSALPDQAVQNMETALDQFMENIEKDNLELAQLVTNAQKEMKSDAERKEQRIFELESKYALLAEQLQESLSRTAAIPAQSAEPNPMAEKQASQIGMSNTEQAGAANEEAVQVNSIKTRYSEMFKLYEQGKSIEMISKKLGMNKGEVQLIIQLAKQEDAAHA